MLSIMDIQVKIIFAKNRIEARRLFMEIHRKGPRDKRQRPVDILEIARKQKGQWEVYYRYGRA